MKEPGGIRQEKQPEISYCDGCSCSQDEPATLIEATRRRHEPSISVAKFVSNWRRCFEKRNRNFRKILKNKYRNLSSCKNSRIFSCNFSDF